MKYNVVDNKGQMLNLGPPLPPPPIDTISALLIRFSGLEGWRLTVVVPIGVSLQFAIDDDILSRIEAPLPIAILTRDRHPSGIPRTSAVVSVDEEVAIVQPGNRKYVLWLGFHVTPGAVDQSGSRKPIQFVWSPRV